MWVRTLPERVRYLYESGMVSSYDSWSRKAGLSPNVANRIATGSDNPRVKTIYALADAVDPPINPYWLAWGIGAPRDPLPETDPQYPTRSFAVSALRALGRNEVAQQLLTNNSFREDPGPVMWFRVAAELLDQHDRLVDGEGRSSAYSPE